jgi:hypothetical protein
MALSFRVIVCGFFLSGTDHSATLSPQVWYSMWMVNSQVASQPHRASVASSKAPDGPHAQYSLGSPALSHRQNRSHLSNKLILSIFSSV